MPLFWLAYRQGGLAGVLILDASWLISARLRASLQTSGIDEHFVSGFEFEREQNVPAKVVGRLLSQAEALQVMKRLPKKRAAASVRRPAWRRSGAKARSYRRTVRK
jgi:hypothetical protein